jgi:hypothetical protein
MDTEKEQNEEVGNERNVKAKVRPETDGTPVIDSTERTTPRRESIPI